MRVEEKRRANCVAEIGEQRAQQGRLARPDLAGEHRKALAVQDGVLQSGQRLTMPATQVEESRIGTEREGRHREVVERVVDCHRVGLVWYAVRCDRSISSGASV